jgi:hypothetical protein
MVTIAVEYFEGRQNEDLCLERLERLTEIPPICWRYRIVIKNDVFWDVRSMALVRTDVSEERVVSIIRMTRMGELGTTLAVTCNRCTLAPMMEAILSSETSALTSHTA